MLLLRLQGRQEGVQSHSGPLPHHYPNQFVEHLPSLLNLSVNSVSTVGSTGKWVRVPNHSQCHTYPQDAGKRVGKIKEGDSNQHGRGQGIHSRLNPSRVKAELSWPARASSSIPLPHPVAATPSPVSTGRSEEGDLEVSFSSSLPVWKRPWEGVQECQKGLKASGHWPGSVPACPAPGRPHKAQFRERQS